MNILWTEHVWVNTQQKLIQIVPLPWSALNEYATRVKRAIIQKWAGTISPDELRNIIRSTHPGAEAMWHVSQSPVLLQAAMHEYANLDDKLTVNTISTENKQA